MKAKILSILLTILLFLFAVSASISAPILCRPFYYAHIQALHLPQTTGWTEPQIREAFDEMMDFELKGTPFGTGDLAWSESGMSHFADCRVLFLLDLWIFGLSGFILAGLFAYQKKTGIAASRLAGRGPSFWAGVLLLLLFGGFGVFAATGFDRAFVLFHRVFFPGKTNWTFDPSKDEIILILPEVFFRNCAILIAALLILFTAIYLIAGRKKAR